MQCFILLGLKFVKEENGATVQVVENLYTGKSGVEMEKMAKLAAETKEYARIEKIINPSGSSMAIDGTPVKHSTPVFPKRVPTAPQVAPQEETPLDRVTNAERQRRYRMGQPQQAATPKAAAATPLPTVDKEVGPGKGTVTQTVPVFVKPGTAAPVESKPVESKSESESDKK